MVLRVTKDWDGRDVFCDECRSANCEYEKDVEHDSGSCEVFRCKDCGRANHVTLPD